MFESENPVEVVRVIDGDTIVFDVELSFDIRKRATIRLLGVDTAETYGVSHDSMTYKTGKEHAEYVIEWLENAGSLSVRLDEKGKFGRWLGVVFDGDGNCLNDDLLKQFDVQYE